MGRPEWHPEWGITGSTVEAQAQVMISHRLCAVQPGTQRGLPGPDQRLSYGSCMQNSQVWAVLVLIGIESVLAPNRRLGARSSPSSPSLTVMWRRRWPTSIRLDPL
jgi:hypothetical protein